jgi:hypothetical protein
MLTFIKTSGTYIAFWLIMWAVSMVGIYFAMRQAVIDAIRIAG